MTTRTPRSSSPIQRPLSSNRFHHRLATPAIVLLLLLTLILHLQSEQMDYSQHTRILDRFAALELAIKEIKLQVVRSYANLPPHYDQLNDAIAALQQSVVALKQQLPAHYQQQVGSIWQWLEQQLTEKMNYLEEYKSHNSRLKNSLNYFMFIATELEQAALYQPIYKPLVPPIKALFQLVIQGYIHHNPAFHDIEQLSGALERQLAGIEDPLFRASLQQYLQHALLFSRFSNEITSKLQQVMLISLQPSTHQLLDHYHAYHQERLMRSQLSRYFMLGTILLLALLILFTIYKLKRQSTHLEQLVHDLDYHKFTIDQHAIVSAADVKGNITYINDKFCQISGYQPHELIGQNHRLLKSDEHDEVFFRQMWRTIAGGQVWHGELKNRRKDGTFYWVSSTIVPFMDSRQKPYQYMSVRTDISARKAIEDEYRANMQFLKSITDTLGQGIYVLNNQGFCIFTNPEAERLLGYSTQELRHSPIHALIHYQRADGSPQPAHACPIMLTNRVGKTYQSDNEFFIRRDGIGFPTSVISVPLSNEQGEVTGSVTLFQDITRRRQTERELSEAKEAAEQASRAKSDFLANMSHEIRTPMNAIIGLSHLALQEELSPRLLDYLEKIHLSSTNLLGIINDILDVSKIEAGKMELESTEFNLDRMLQEMATLVSIRADEKGLELLIHRDVDVPNQLIGDPLRLKQIVLNLANNAVKFTHRGLIEIGVSRLSEELLQFRVSDSGIGIALEQQDSLFQPFVQSDSSTTRRYGGTGLGLTISKQLVQMMGGTIRLSSVLGEGSCFSFTLPLSGARRGVESLPPLKVTEIVLFGTETLNRVVPPLLPEGVMGQIAADLPQLLEQLNRLSPQSALLLDLFKLRQLSAADRELLRQRLGREQPPVVAIFNRANDNLDQLRQQLDLPLTHLIQQPLSLINLYPLFGQEAALVAVAQPTTEPQQLLGGCQLLLAEDNLINQLVARELLGRMGAKVTIANNGAEAVAWVQQQPFDLVMMDIQMPTMDGLEATRQIRRLGERFRDLPIIAMTANAMEQDRQRSMDAGMNDHVTKPIDIPQLTRVVSYWYQPLS